MLSSSLAGLTGVEALFAVSTIVPAEFLPVEAATDDVAGVAFVPFAAAATGGVLVLDVAGGSGLGNANSAVNKGLFGTTYSNRNGEGPTANRYGMLPDTFCTANNPKTTANIISQRFWVREILLMTINFFIFEGTPNSGCNTLLLNRQKLPGLEPYSLKRWLGILD